MRGKRRASLLTGDDEDGEGTDESLIIVCGEDHISMFVEIKYRLTFREQN